jgi:hypothetical protein
MVEADPVSTSTVGISTDRPAWIAVSETKGRLCLRVSRKGDSRTEPALLYDFELFPTRVKIIIFTLGMSRMMLSVHLKRPHTAIALLYQYHVIDDSSAVGTGVST